MTLGIITSSSGASTALAELGLDRCRPQSSNHTHESHVPQSHFLKEVQWAGIVEMSPKGVPVSDVVRARARRSLRDEEAKHPLIVLLDAAPPWLLARAIEEVLPFGKTRRLLHAMGVCAVSDLRAYSISDLLRLPKFGTKRIEGIRRNLLRALEERPSTRMHGPPLEGASRTLMQELRFGLSKLDARERDIIVRRMGLGRGAETLQKIAKRHNLSRERVRQIEARAVQTLGGHRSCEQILSAKLDGLAEAYNTPIPVQAVEAADAWFTGIIEFPVFFRRIVNHCCLGHFQVDDIDGVEYLFQGSKKTPTDPRQKI